MFIGTPCRGSGVLVEQLYYCIIMFIGTPCRGSEVQVEKLYYCIIMFIGTPCRGSEVQVEKLYYCIIMFIGTPCRGSEVQVEKLYYCILMFIGSPCRGSEVQVEKLCYCIDTLSDFTRPLTTHLQPPGKMSRGSSFNQEATEFYKSSKPILQQLTNLRIVLETSLLKVLELRKKQRGPVSRGELQGIDIVSPIKLLSETVKSLDAVLEKFTKLGKQEKQCSSSLFFRAR
ncbi:uncharacterized protein LOC111713960 [Eurytemora carolleeae]|uniref:uncharacterized protein LOC111713960 n=1 Tax=Eurytemora carolleeae TaxID=1294199 RepID=UPI000C75C6F9|nr:uncharacterized protein LOC111713960 [Eurytemora carolleeae]|eukprot:XP_023344725.1 uncharacterized protein LOC111713960 [Eurytemora affinis]